MSRSLTASDRSSLIRLASFLPAGSAERKAILAGLSKVSGSSEGSGTARRPISVKGKKFTDWEYKIDSKSIYITLYNDAGSMVWAERREDLSDKEWFSAAVTQVAANLKSGDLPEGFGEQDFQKG